VWDQNQHGARIEYDIDGAAIEYGPETLFPAAFVSSAGTDGAGFGYSARTPFATLKYALESNRCGNGYAVHLLTGFTDAGVAATNISAPIKTPAQIDKFPLIIYGQGRDGAAINSSATSYFFRMYAAPRTGRVDVHDIRYVNSGNGRFVDSNLDANTSKIRIFDSYLENAANTTDTRNGVQEYVRSILRRSSSGSNVINNSAAAAGSKTLFDSCHIVGGTNGILPANTSVSEIRGRNTTISECTAYDVDLNLISDKSKTPVLTNCLFASSGSTASIRGNATVTYDAADFAGCVANKAATQLNAGSGLTVNTSVSVTGYRAAAQYSNANIDADIEGKSGQNAGCFVN
jgi:hypothetical protein